MAKVFVSYYTGQPDMVPHIAEVCMVAGGLEPEGKPGTAFVQVPGVGAPDDRIPVRVVTARPHSRGPVVNRLLAGDQTVTVMEFFLDEWKQYMHGGDQQHGKQWADSAPGHVQFSDKGK